MIYACLLVCAVSSFGYSTLLSCILVAAFVVEAAPAWRQAAFELVASGPDLTNNFGEVTRYCKGVVSLAAAL